MKAKISIKTPICQWNPGGQWWGQKIETSSDYDVIWGENYAPSEEKPKLPNDRSGSLMKMNGSLPWKARKAMKFTYSYKDDFGVDADWSAAFAKAKVSQIANK